MIAKTALIALTGTASLTAVLNQAAEVPFDKALGLGTAGALIFVCGMFLKHTSEMRREGNATTEKVAGDFAETIRETKQVFADTVAKLQTSHQEQTQVILRETRESQTQLHQLVRDITKKDGTKQ